MFVQIRSFNFLIRQQVPFARWIEPHLFVAQLNHTLACCQGCVSRRKYVLSAILNIRHPESWHLQLREGGFAELEHIRIYLMVHVR